MRSLGIVISALLVAVTAAPAGAQDAAAMRREIEQLRQQLQGLTERLQRLETQPAPQMGRRRRSPVRWHSRRRIHRRR